jgi:hypothetical protein
VALARLIPSWVSAAPTCSIPDTDLAAATAAPVRAGSRTAITTGPLMPGGNDLSISFWAATDPAVPLKASDWGRLPG